MDTTGERYAAIFSAMAEGVVIQDADGRIEACNESAERILGLTAGQVSGVTWMDHAGGQFMKTVRRSRARRTRQRSPSKHASL